MRTKMQKGLLLLFSAPQNKSREKRLRTSKLQNLSLFLHWHFHSAFFNRLGLGFLTSSLWLFGNFLLNNSKMEVDDEYKRKAQIALVVIVVLASLAMIALLIAFSYYCYIRIKVANRRKNHKSELHFIFTTYDLLLFINGEWNFQPLI